MRKVIVGAFVSMDGVMQAPGGPQEDPAGGFRYGGWLVPYFDESLGVKIGEIFARPFDLLLGRKTYDIFAAHWPYVGPEEPLGALFDQIEKYVATRNSNFKPDWQNSRVLGADVVAAIRKLKEEEGPDLLTQGSTDFLQTLHAHDLVDEMYIMIFPLVLGKGKRLFAEGAAPAAFELLSTQASDSGVIVNHYVRAGDIETGSFAAESPSPAELERRKHLS